MLLKKERLGLLSLALLAERSLELALWLEMVRAAIGNVFGG